MTQSSSSPMQAPAHTRTGDGDIAHRPDPGPDSKKAEPAHRDNGKNLISSDRVEGTAVYASDGEKIGHIDHLMIGKKSGRVEYAVMNFGGFLGVGELSHPLPWDALDYDADQDGYVVKIDKSKLYDAPSYDKDSYPLYDRQYGQSVFGFYNYIY